MSAVLVILTYRDGDRAAGLAGKVVEYTAFDHIVLVDNHSGDDTFKKLSAVAEDYPEKIHAISAPENGGYAKGNNFGIRYALEHFDPNYIFVANPDTFFTDGTCLAMKECLREHREYGVVAPLVSSGYNAWDLPGFWGVVRSLFLISFTLHKRALRKRIMRSGESPVPVGAVEGSFFAISRRAYDLISGFDERTFLYGEEIMLSFRLKLYGYSTGILPEERYDHLHSATIRKLHRSSKARVFHYFRESFGIYNEYYLRIGPLGRLLFSLAYMLAYGERVVYDHIVRK